jgi:hypothetical protein
MTEKTHHVLDQLPQHQPALRERMMVDREFRSLCEDDGDTLDALRCWEVSADRHRAARVEEFRRLLVALDMVMGGSHEDRSEKPKALSPDIAVFPFAMPMMATPQGLVAITVLVAARKLAGGINDINIDRRRRR